MTERYIEITDRELRQARAALKSAGFTPETKTLGETIRHINRSGYLKPFMRAAARKIWNVHACEEF